MKNTSEMLCQHASLCVGAYRKKKLKRNRVRQTGEETDRIVIVMGKRFEINFWSFLVFGHEHNFSVSEVCIQNVGCSVYL